MNVCILSMQRIDNFGSLLQAYSLKSIIEGLGASVCFIDIEKDDEAGAFLENKLNFSEESENGRKNRFRVLNYLKGFDKYFITRVSNHFRKKKQSSLFESFRLRNLEISQHKDFYDLCVIGSDEVFNFATISPWGFTRQLFGKVLCAKKVITYAASCGATTIGNLNPPIERAIRESFANIRGFSVRDQNTYEFVSHLTDCNVCIHLDPVLIGRFDKEIASARRRIKSKRYCLLYAYENRINKEEEIEEIKTFCKAKGMELICVGSPQKWSKRFVPLSPFELLKAFSESAFVITDTFHGTIFAVKYAARFAVILRDSNRNKLYDLLTRLGQCNHLYANTTLESIYDIESPKAQISDCLEEERSRSSDYLTRFMIEDKEDE